MGLIFFVDALVVSPLAGSRALLLIYLVQCLLMTLLAVLQRRFWRDVHLHLADSLRPLARPQADWRVD